MDDQASKPLAWLDDALAELERTGLRRRLAVRQQEQNPVSMIDDLQLINFGANDYLQLAADSRLLTAVKRSLQTDGWGSGASPLVCGRTQLHADLEARLAHFEESPAALLFPSGYAANVGALTALAGEADLILSDSKNHASIIDGCRLSRATTNVYRHLDVDDAEQQLRRAAGYRRKWIVTDGLFSMDGDLAPLGSLADLAVRYDAGLIVDEAHATGVFGKHGRGVAEHFGVEDLVAVRIGTLSKALGSIGGFVTGSQSLIDWLANKSRGYVFSTAAPAATCAAALAALDVVGTEPERRQRLLERAAWLRNQLVGQGWKVGRSESQIIPIQVGDPEAAVGLSAQLRERGFFVPAIRPPSVPPGESLLRLSLSYGHTEEMLNSFVAALEELSRPGRATHA